MVVITRFVAYSSRPGPGRAGPGIRLPSHREAGGLGCCQVEERHLPAETGRERDRAPYDRGAVRDSGHLQGDGGKHTDLPPDRQPVE